MPRRGKEKRDRAELARERRAFAEERAPALLASIRPGLAPYAEARPDTSRLSATMAYFAGEGCLALVAGPQDEHDGLVLAHGLHQAAGRALVLVVPAAVAAPIALCLPWLSAPIELWAFDEAGSVRRVALSKADAQGSIDDPVVVPRLELGARASWIAPLVEWARTAGLVAAHRTSYLAWHCEGRLVLKVRRGRGGLVLSAGVHSEERTLELTLEGPISEAELTELARAAEGAVEARREGKDDQNREHRLQSALVELADELGLVELQREFPVIRRGHRAYMDFLAIDRDRRLHVIETKLAHDPQLILQGLEYWIWVEAHLGTLARLFEADASLPPHLDFVLQRGSPRTELLDCYSVTLAGALDPEIPWRVHEVRQGAGGRLELLTLTAGEAR